MATSAPVVRVDDQDRVTLHLSGYEFEVVVRETATAESTADLLHRQLTQLVNAVGGGR